MQWLLTQQAEDGGFIGFSGESDAGATVDAVLALASAQSAGIDVDLESAMKYLESQALVYAQFSPGAAAKLSMALVAAGMNPHDIDHVDPMSIVVVAAGAGMIGMGPYDHALGLQALVATGEPVPDAAIQAARDSQIEDGSWAFDGTMTPGAGDTNTTAMMVMGLVAAGIQDETVDRAIAYLAGSANDDGGYPYQPGAESDANSTSLVLQAFVAAADPDLADAQDDGADRAAGTAKRERSIRLYGLGARRQPVCDRAGDSGGGWGCFPDSSRHGGARDPGCVTGGDPRRVSPWRVWEFPRQKPGARRAKPLRGCTIDRSRTLGPAPRGAAAWIGGLGSGRYVRSGSCPLRRYRDSAR